MAKKIQIICTKPGMRRLGVEHPASATYDNDHWSADQLQAFKNDPSFVVQEIDESAIVIAGDEIDKAVASQVEAQLKAKVDELQKSFEVAVKDAAAEKVSAAEAELAMANARIAELETEIAKTGAAKVAARK